MRCESRRSRSHSYETIEYFRFHFTNSSPLPDFDLDNFVPNWDEACTLYGFSAQFVSPNGMHRRKLSAQNFAWAAIMMTQSMLILLMHSNSHLSFVYGNRTILSSLQPIVFAHGATKSGTKCNLSRECKNVAPWVASKPKPCGVQRCKGIRVQCQLRRFFCRFDVNCQLLFENRADICLRSTTIIAWFALCVPFSVYRNWQPIDNMINLIGQ